MNAKDKNKKTLYTIGYRITQSSTKNGKAQKVIRDACQAPQTFEITSKVNFNPDSKLTENKCTHKLETEGSNIFINNPDAINEVFFKKQKQ